MGDRPDFLVEVRSTYGGAHIIEDFGAPLVHDWITIINIVEKGIIYGGYLCLQSDRNAHASRLRLTLDGVETPDIAPENLWVYGCTHPWTSYWWVSRYDLAEKRVVTNLSPGITFETGFKIEIFPDFIANYGSRWSIAYATI